MTDATIAILAAWGLIIILTAAFHVQGKELEKETAQRRRWQKIAHEHADHAKRLENLAEKAQDRQERWEHLYRGQTPPHDLDFDWESMSERWKTMPSVPPVERPEHPNCRCTILPGDHTPVTYMLINGHVTRPYAIGKSPFLN